MGRVAQVRSSRADNEGVDARCALCGRPADPVRDDDPAPGDLARPGQPGPLGWSADIVEAHGGKRTRWVCPECTRVHVRAIEAKLEQQWW